HVPFKLEPQAPGKLDVEAAHRLLDRIINEEPMALECRDAPAGFGHMVAEKLLAKDRSARYQTMKEVQGALAAFAGVAATPVVLASAPQSPEVQQLGSRWRVASGDLVLELFSDEMHELADVVTAAAAIADEMKHYPMIALELPRLRVTLSSAAAGTDLVYAARLEQWLRDHGW
ncbi:MAG TPA: 4a-hydroxytetrahydrobiopterin dehydratase, partial [Kofleriaceae bacterium]|nr:4a-hydroxytetrahydrobiopterin dehydratase [Kofleriaceae bacterium]